VQDSVLRRIFLAFIQVHILHHASKEPIYGSWMIEELQSHGYEISAGTLYPIFHRMEKSGLLKCEKVLVEGKHRKYYSITTAGAETLENAREKIATLSDEIE